MLGIDVSAYQSFPDWVKVKQSIEFAILRITTPYGTDKSFEHNYKGCQDNNIKTGAYRYSYAKTVEASIKEAQEVLKILNNRHLELGVWLDLEWDKQRALGKNAITDIAKAFIETIQNGGYKCGIYCNLDWYKNVIDVSQFKDIPFWIARYPYNDTGKIVETLKPNVSEYGWQYSSKGRISGINGYVDLDIFYSNSNLEDTIPVKTKQFDKEAVKSLQTALNLQGITGLNNSTLVVDGIVGQNTLTAIKKSTLSRGSSGYVVQWLKMRLDTVFGNTLQSCLGYTLTNGVIPSNVYNENTEKAVLLYQTYKGLQVDGIAGQNTITELLYEM